MRKIFLSILIIIFIYIFYKSEFYWNGEKRDYYLIYYLISGFLILINIIIVFFNVRLNTYFIISLISFFFSLYLYEFYLTVNGFKDTVNAQKYFDKDIPKKVKLYKLKTGLDYETRNKLEFYSEKKKYSNFAVIVSPNTHIKENPKLQPLSGTSFVKTIYCNENGYYQIYDSDRNGFNNPDQEWDKKNIDYLFIGDSYFHGACVNRPYDAASVLRKLSKKSVLNLSYAGNGPLIQYATLREYMPKNVKNIYWSFFKNDLRELKHELESEILNNYLVDLEFSQNLKYKQELIDKIVTKKITNTFIDQSYTAKAKENKILNNFRKFKFLDYFNFSKFLKLYKLRFNLIHKENNTTFENKNINKNFTKILKLAKDLAEKNGSKFNVVYIPSYFKLNTSYEDILYNNLKEVLKELDIPLIDIYEAMKKNNGLEFLPFNLPNGHFNKKGYKLIAEEIYKSSK